MVDLNLSTYSYLVKFLELQSHVTPNMFTQQPAPLHKLWAHISIQHHAHLVSTMYTLLVWYAIFSI